MGLSASTRAAAAAAGDIEGLIDRTLASARAAARSELEVLKNPVALANASREVAGSKCDPRLLIALRRIKIQISLILAVLESSLKSTGERRRPAGSTARGGGRAVHDIVLSLTLALAARDRGTALHSRRVARHAVRTARRLGLPRGERRRLLHAALLHDIGKIGTKDAVLHKPAALNVEERRHMNEHVDVGTAILSKLAALAPLAPLVAAHHERLDGTGYPLGRAGQAIPVGAQIISVADAFDALEEDRCYRPGLPLEHIKQHLLAHAGTHFHPDVVDAFFAQLEAARAGSVSRADVNGIAS